MTLSITSSGVPP